MLVVETKRTWEVRWRKKGGREGEKETGREGIWELKGMLF